MQIDPRKPSFFRTRTLPAPSWMLSACLGLALSACSGSDYSEPEPPAPPATFTYSELISIFDQQGVDGETAPVVRIVSPLNEALIAPGTSSPEGSGFLVNVEIVTRGEGSVAGVTGKEATLAPPVFGIRHVPELEAGAPNPDFPGLFVFFDTDLITPDGATLAAGHNFGAAFNVLGTDDTPGPGVTLWAGWHVLESVPAGVEFVTMSVAVVDDAGRIGLDRVKLKVAPDAGSGQALTPADTSFPGAAARFQSTLTGAAERPTPVPTTASGNGSVVYDWATGIAKVRVSFQGLTSNQTIAHIHSGDPGVAGPIVFDLDTADTPPTVKDGSFEKDWAIDAANLVRLQNGQLYFNVHSENFPAGEVRGQILPDTSDPLAPVVTLVAPRAPTALAIGPQDAASLNAGNGALFFIQVSALDHSDAGIAVNETGIRPGNTLPAGLIFDPSQIPNGSTGAVGGANRNMPGLNLSFDVPLRQPNGNVVPAGVNLAPLFDIAGSEFDSAHQEHVLTTAHWVVGGALLPPAGKADVTITAYVTDNAGHTGVARQSFPISAVVSGQDLTPNPAAP